MAGLTEYQAEISIRELKRFTAQIEHLLLQADPLQVGGALLWLGCVQGVIQYMDKEVRNGRQETE